jgi:hypothetical protein
MCLLFDLRKWLSLQLYSQSLYESRFWWKNLGGLYPCLDVEHDNWLDHLDGRSCVKRQCLCGSCHCALVGYFDLLHDFGFSQTNARVKKFASVAVCGIGSSVQHSRCNRHGIFQAKVLATSVTKSPAVSRRTRATLKEEAITILRRMNATSLFINSAGTTVCVFSYRTKKRMFCVDYSVQCYKILQPEERLELLASTSLLIVVSRCIIRKK